MGFVPKEFRHIKSNTAGANDGYPLACFYMTEQHIDITQGFFVPDTFDFRHMRIYAACHYNFIEALQQACICFLTQA